MVIKGASGTLSGKEFDVKGTLLIGRNRQSCNVLFPDDAVGVSRAHCKIESGGGNATITDMGSSYGTFLNGKKLSAHVPYAIKNGDVFYLGDKSNSFMVSGNAGGAGALRVGEKQKRVIGIAAALLAVVVIAVILTLTLTSRKSLVGTWEVVGAPGTRMSFTEDGELIITENGEFSINGQLTYSKAGDNMVSIKYTAPVKTTTKELNLSAGLLKIFGIGGGSSEAVVAAYSNGYIWKYDYNPKIKSMVVRDINGETLFVMTEDPEYLRK
ncbi:MAG TPA: hypothetical protein DCL38_02390 [Lachnospiraceae bacterium]|nr:hypothetical protein [Lachnospiraceae bacterium]